MPGTVRIVAQIQSAPGVALEPVQFFVDGTLLSTVSDGPPYAAEWVDENPFDPRDITVMVTDTLGNTAHDAVRLKPLEVFDESQVTSVLVDATVQDKSGRFVRDLTGQDFRIFEDGVPQKLDMAARDEVGATFALLVDSSQAWRTGSTWFVRRRRASAGSCASGIGCLSSRSRRPSGR